VVEAWRLRTSLEAVISELRGGGSCRVKISSVEPGDAGYRVRGTYTLREYVFFSGEKLLESGEFEAKLDKEYKLISISISPSTQRRGTAR